MKKINIETFKTVVYIIISLFAALSFLLIILGLKNITSDFNEDKSRGIYFLIASFISILSSIFYGSALSVIEKIVEKVNTELSPEDNQKITNENKD